MRRATDLEIFKFSLGFYKINSMIVIFHLWNYSLLHVTNSPTTFGIIIAIGGSVYLITTLIFGVFADRNRSDVGRFRSWIFKGGIFLAILSTFLFIPVPLSSGLKLIYAVVIYICYSIFSSIYDISYNATTPLMSDDSNQITRIIVIRNYIGIIHILVPFSLSLLFKDDSLWLFIALFNGLVVIITSWLAQNGLKRHDSLENYNLSNEVIPIKEQLEVVYKNKPLILIIIAASLTILPIATSQSMLFNLLRNFNNHNLLGYYILILSIHFLLILPLLPVLVRKLGKKRLFVISIFGLSLLNFILSIVSKSSIIFKVSLFINTGLSIIPGFVSILMVYDCIDYAEWKFGFRGDGTIISIQGLLSNLAKGLFVTLFVTGMYIFNKKIPVIQTNILYPMVSIIIALVIMKYYSLDKTKVKEIKETLIKRRHIIKEDEL